MGIYILLIFIVPFAITGIAYQVGAYSSVKPQSQADYYIATFLGAVLLFFLPLQWVDNSAYVFWLFWAALTLSVGYFVVRSHREELQNNPISRLIGGSVILIILISSLIAIYPEKEVNDDGARDQIIKSMMLKSVKDNIRADTTCEFKNYMGYVRCGNQGLFKLDLGDLANDHPSYKFYKNIGVFSHYGGVDIIDMKSGETMWQQKIEPYSGGISTMVIGSLLILRLYEKVEMPAGQINIKEHLFAINLDSMNVQWDNGIKMYSWHSNQKLPIANTFFLNTQIIAQPVDNGLAILDPVNGKVKYHFAGTASIIDATKTQFYSYDNNQISGWDAQSSRLIWRHSVEDLTFVYNRYAIATQSGKILIIDLSNGKIKARIKPRYQLRQFSVNGKYLMIDDKLYEPIESI
jgi:hypothetical protein